MFELLLLIFVVWLVIKLFFKVVDVPVKAVTKLKETVVDDHGPITQADLDELNKRVKEQPDKPAKQIVNEYLREKALIRALPGKSVIVVSEDELFNEKV